MMIKMMIRDWRRPFARLLALAALLTGVGAFAQPAATVTIGLPFSVTARMFDPADVTNNTTFPVLYAMHDALTKTTENGIQPSLAASVTHDKDLTEFTYKLKPGIKFHDGSPLTSEDVKFSLERYKGLGAGDIKQRIAAIETPDPLTVRVKLKGPWPDYLVMTGTISTGYGWIVPKKYIEQVGEAGFAKAPIGAGPFRLEGMTAGQQMSFTRFADFHGRKPKVEKLVLRTVTDAAQMLAQVNGGQLDIGHFVTGDLVAAAEKMPNLRVATTLTSSVFYLKFLDAADPNSPWSKRDVRAAVNLLIDRQAISDIETAGISPITSTIVPPEFEYSWTPPVTKRNVEEAKRLLRRAGYPSGFNGGQITPLPPYFKITEAIASMLAEAGIKVEIQKLDRAVYYERLAKKNLTGVCLCVEGGPGNAAMRLERHMISSGIYNYKKEPEMDKLFEAQKNETSREKRMALLQSIQKMSHEMAYDAPIFQIKIRIAVNNRVKEPALFVPGHPYTAPFELLELK